MVDQVNAQEVDPVDPGGSTYPVKLACEVMTTNGLMVHLRPIRPDDDSDLDHLASAALATGITAFVAETLAENRDMVGVFRHSGFPIASTTEYGTVSIRFSIQSDQVSYRHVPHGIATLDSGPQPKVDVR
jgi:hypothetical protein